MANRKGKGIIIDVGFTSDINTFLDNLESKIKSKDFGKIIGISGAFNEEYKKMSELINKIREGINSLNGTDIKKISAQMENITALTTKLNKAFLTLTASIPESMQKELGLKKLTDELSGISGVVVQTKQSFTELAKSSTKDMSVMRGEAQKLYNQYKELRGELKRLREPKEYGGYGKPKNIDVVLREIQTQKELLDAAQKEYEDITGGKKEGSVDASLKQYATSLEKLRGLINWYNKIQPDSMGMTFKPIKMSIAELSNYIDKEFNVAQERLIKRLNTLQEMGEKNGADFASRFIQDTRKSEEPIRVTIALAKGAQGTLNREVLDVIEETNKVASAHPVKVEMQLASAYQSRTNQASIKEIQQKIRDLEQQAINAGSDAERIKIMAISNDLTELIDKMNRQIDNALTITAQLDATKATTAVQEFVKWAQAELKKPTNSLTVPISFDTSVKDITAAKQEYINAFTDEDQKKLSSTLSEALVGKLDDISKAADKLSNFFKADDNFSQNILLKAESLNQLYTQLLMVNEELDLFIKGISQLDKKQTKDILSFATESQKTLQQSIDEIKNTIPKDKTFEIELMIKNKDLILKNISLIKQELSSLFDTKQISTWENSVLSALSKIKTSTGGTQLFEPQSTKNTQDLFSWIVDDIVRTDQMIRTPSINKGEVNDHTARENKITQTVNDLINRVDGLNKAKDIFNKDFLTLQSKKTLSLEEEKKLQSLNKRIHEISNEINQAIEDTLNTLKENHSAKQKLPIAPREHGGVITVNGDIYGLTGVDRPGATRYANGVPYGVSNKDIYAGVHSHSGDLIWMPSSADLQNYNRGKFKVTIAENEIGVVDVNKQKAFEKKHSIISWDNIFDEAAQWGKDNAKSESLRKEFKEFKKPYEEQRQKLINAGVVVDEEREKTLVQHRFVLDKFLKSKYGEGLDTFAQTFNHEEFKRLDPLGLKQLGGKTNVNDNSIEQIITKALENSSKNDSNNTYLEAINNNLAEILAILKTKNASPEEQLAQLKARRAELVKQESEIKSGIINKNDELNNETTSSKRKAGTKKYSAAQQIELDRIAKEKQDIDQKIAELEKLINQTSSQSKNGVFKEIEELDIEKIDKLIELFTKLSTVLEKISGDKLSNGLNSIATILSNFPSKKNPVLTQLENITKDSEALKALGESVKAGNKIKAGTKEDAKKLLKEKEDDIRSQANEYLMSRLGISPKQIEQATKDAQTALDKSWANYDATTELVENGGMENSVAEEYANVFIDAYKDALTKGLKLSLTDEQKEFLAPMMDELRQIVPRDVGEFRITDLKATKDGLVDIIALVKTANGEYEKLVLKYQELADGASILVDKVETGADAAKAYLAEDKMTKYLGELTKEKDIVDNIGNVAPGTESWKTLLDLANKFGIKVEEINKIIRNVDREGFESFQFFTKDGSRTTLGVNSETTLWERNPVVTMKDDLKEYDKLVDLMSKTTQGAFKGDEASAIKFLTVLERIRDIWKNLLVYHDEGMLDDKTLGEKGELFSGTIGYIGNQISGINTKGKPQDFKDLVADTVAEFDTLKGSLDLTSLINQDQTSIEQLVQSLRKIMVNLTVIGQNRDKAFNSITVDKWTARISDYLRKNSSIPKEYQKQFKDLRSEMNKLKEQYGDAVPSDLFTPLMQQVTALESKMKEAGYAGRSMFDKMKTAMKNSILQVTRMYLSWYRLIAYIRQGAQEVIQMDTALTKMSYTMNVTQSQLQLMSKDMVDMAKSLSTSVSNIEQIYQIYANLKTSQAELEQIAKPTAILANLSGSDAATAADQIQGVLNQFEMAADSAMHVVDVYDKISASIKVDYSKGIQGMSEAVQSVGNYAYEAGLSFEQLSSIIAKTMEKTRQDGSAIGNAIKTIAVRISKANKLADPDEVNNETLSNASAALHKVGVEVYNVNGQYRELDTILGELAKVWPTLNDAQRADISFKIAATRQSAMLSAILNTYNDAMELSTEAINANGNAMANQQKYTKSLVGQIESLKTEFSALWFDLLSSDSIKDLLSSIKEMIVNLSDSASGLKPVIDLLAELLKIVSKIISIVPSSGLIVSILGLKYGKTISSAIRYMGKFTNTISICIRKFGLVKTAAKLFSKELFAIQAINPVGAIIIALTTLQTIIGALTTSTEEFEQEYNNVLNEFNQSQTDIENINKKLEEQQGIINELSGKHLSYIDQEQLTKAKEYTSELKTQLWLTKETAKESGKEVADKASKKLLESGFYKTAEEAQAAFLMSDSDLDLTANALSQAYTKWNLPDKVYYDSFGNKTIIPNGDLAGINKEEALKNLTELNKYVTDQEDYYNLLVSLKEDYEKGINSIKITQDDLNWMSDFETYKDMINFGSKWLNPNEWNTDIISSFIQENRSTFDSIKSQITSSNSLDFIADLIRTKFSKEIMNGLNLAEGSGYFQGLYLNHITDPYRLVAMQFASEISDINDQASSKIEPISYTKWIQEESNASNGDKKYLNKELIETYKSAIDSLSQYVSQDRGGEVVVNLGEVIRVTGDKDSLFQKLGMDSFEEYLSDSDNNPFVALGKYVDDFEQKLLNSTDTALLTDEGYKTLIQDLDKMKQEVFGASDSFEKLDKNYYELLDLLDKITNKQETFTKDQLDYWLTKYPELQGNITQVAENSWTIQTDGIKTLITKYAELSNAAVAFGLNNAKAILEATMATYNLSDSIDEVIEKYTMFSETDEDRFRNTNYENQKNDALVRAVQNYNDAKKLYKDYKDAEKDIENTTGISSAKNSIDWIANSLENIARRAEDAQSAYDRLLTKAGSTSALEKANAQLSIWNEELQNQVAGFNKAAVSYQEELDKLNLSTEDMERIKNYSLTNEDGWTIEEFKNDNTKYEKYNKALDLYRKITDAQKNALDKENEILQNNIQKLQNLLDNITATTSATEAQLAVTTRTNKQQKLIKQLREEYSEQYALQIAIARSKGDELEETKLMYEWEQKLNELDAQISQTALDNVTTKYDRLLSEYENRQAILEHGLEMNEKRGYMANANYYRAMINNEVTEAQKLLNERERLIEILNNTGTGSKEELDTWWNIKNQIDSVTSELYESQGAIQDWQNAIDDLQYEVFNRIQDTISGIKDEAEFLANLFRNDDLFKSIKQMFGNDLYGTKIYQGGYSDEGLAVLGLHAVQLKTNKELAENYAKELEEVNEQLADDPANVRLLDRRNELLQTQRESISAAEAEKDAILDLVREGYDKQLSSLEELSSKYMEALQAEKDLYDYQKNISKQTKDIVTLRKRIAAYSTDNSEESRSKLQQLNVQLQEAEEGLADSQYEHFIQDQQNILDQLYKNFEGYLNEQMEDRDARLKEIEDLIDQNFDNIENILTGAAGAAGTNITGTMGNIWSQPLSDIGTIRSKIANSDTNISAIEDSTSNIDNTLKNYANSYGTKIKDIINDDQNKIGQINNTINSLNSNFEVGSHLMNNLKDQKETEEEQKRLLNDWFGTGDKLNQLLKDPNFKLSVADIKQAIIDALNDRDAGKTTTDYQNSNLYVGAGLSSKYGVSSSNFYNGSKYGNFTSFKKIESLKKIYDTMMNKEGTALLKDDPRYGEFEDDEKYYKIMYQWLKRNGYASGSRRIPKSQIAWTQENGLEAIIRPSDGAILTPLAKNDTVLNAGATQNIWDMANNPIQFIRDNLSFPISLPANMSGGSYDIDQSMTLVLPNVMNYPEFVSALQSDKKFEKMLQDMTVNQLTNKNALAKYKYNYK